MDNQENVRAFHEKYGFAITRDLREEHSDLGLEDFLTWSLVELSKQLRSAANRSSSLVKRDLRIARVNLIAEELAELTEALAERDVVAMADAVADLAVVVYGTAVAYGVPLDACFDEVMRSNMTKDTDGEHKPAKGAGYSPPNLRELLR